MKAENKPKDDLKALAKRLGVTKADLLSHCRKAELVDARSMVVALMMERHSLRQQDVAPLLDISQAAVSKLLNRHRAMMNPRGGNPTYRETFEAFTSQISDGLDCFVPRNDEESVEPASRHCERSEANQSGPASRHCERSEANQSGPASRHCERSEANQRNN